MDPKGSKPHVFQVGQVVWWGNGYDGYVLIKEQTPLHCDGGGPSYRVWDRIGSRDCVSEEVLRPLTLKEAGVSVNVSGSRR